MAYSASMRLAAALSLRRPDPWETNESTSGRANCKADSRFPPGCLEQSDHLGHLAPTVQWPGVRAAAARLMATLPSSSLLHGRRTSARWRPGP